MSNHRIPLHFAKTDTTEPLATFDGLLREGMNRSSGSDLKFIVHHVPQTLIEHTPDVNVGIELGSEDARVHRFVSMIVISRFQ